VRTLVTGGAGFIGSHLVDALLAEGHSVTAVDDLSRGRREQVDRRAEFIELDVTDAKLHQVVAASGADTVFHHAAQIDVRVSMREPVEDTRVNVLGTVNLLDACAASGVRRVVFASTGGAIYGDADTLPTPEDQPRRPQSPYGTSKLSAEAYGETFQRNGGPEFVSLRYANVYGPRQDPHGEAGVVAIFATKLLSGEPVVINGDGLQTRDYVYVDDVVRANLCAISAAQVGSFNIGTGLETSVNELFLHIRDACGSSTSAVHGEAKPGEQMRSALAIERAKRLLGWAPAVDLEEGLQRTVAFFRGD
jgi:UDP-glucose 4-epimerase